MTENVGKVRTILLEMVVRPTKPPIQQHIHLLVAPCDTTIKKVDLNEKHSALLREDVMRIIRRYKASKFMLDPNVSERTGEALRALWRSTFKPSSTVPADPPELA